LPCNGVPERLKTKFNNFDDNMVLKNLRSVFSEDIMKHFWLVKNPTSSYTAKSLEAKLG
jgi:hypothetical protein